MSEIQLNKPLYKPGSPADAGEPRPQLPRNPRPSLMPRMGAVLVDILVLHFLFLLIIKVAPAAVVKLGNFGSWAGLLGAWLYYAICGSHITLGRTLGKLVMRLQVGDVAGPDLSFNRAAFRAALLIGPAALPIAMGQYGASIQNRSVLDPFAAFLPALGWAVVWGWLIGNALFSAGEPFGRTFYDRVAESVVTTSDAEPTLLQEHLAALRGSAMAPAPPKSYFGLIGSIALLLTIAGTFYYRHKTSINALSEKEQQELVHLQESFRIAGFPTYGLEPTMQNAGAEKVDASTTAADVLVANIVYERLGTVNIDTVKSDPETARALDRFIHLAQTEPSFQGWYANMFNRLNQSRMQQGEATTTVPKQMRLMVSFAEKADLLFASDKMTKYSMSQLLDVDPGDPSTSRPLTVRIPQTSPAAQKVSDSVLGIADTDSVTSVGPMLSGETSATVGQADIGTSSVR